MGLRGCKIFKICDNIKQAERNPQ